MMQDYIEHTHGASAKTASSQPRATHENAWCYPIRSASSKSGKMALRISEVSFSSHQTPATLPPVYLPQRHPDFFYSFDHILYSASSI